MHYYIPKLVIHKIIMYICLMYSSELIKGTLIPIILKLLSENERMYGYEITQHVKRITEEKIQLTEGALYPTLHKLEAEGLLRIEKVNIGKRVRKYYHLTTAGNERAKEKIAEFLHFMETMKDLLNPQPLHYGTVIC